MYRSSYAIDVYARSLPIAFPDLCEWVKLPHRTVEGRVVSALRLGAGERANRRGVLLVGGTHARELMNPDLLIELAVELCVAYRDGTTIRLGERTWSTLWISLIMENLDIYVVPNLNPDGREEVLRPGGNRWWRKNRRVTSTSCTGDYFPGVDLNRNADILWGVTMGASCDPCSLVFCGPDAFSEPETRNVRWLLDRYRVDCFVDVHSYSEVILHPWGHADTQTTDATRRFTSLATSTCAPLADRDHVEYMKPKDLRMYRVVGDRVADAIEDVRGRRYRVAPVIDLHEQRSSPVTGALSEYAWARHIADPSARKTYGWTFETGPDGGDPYIDSFQPTDPEPIKEEAKSGLLMMLSQWVCGIDLIAAGVIGAESAGSGLRFFRDTVLLRTDAGERWVELFERHQTELALAVLSDRSLGEQIARVLLAADDLINGRTSQLAEDDARRARRVVARLQGRTDDPDAQRALGVIDALLDRLAGQDLESIAAVLLTEPPPTS